MPVRTADATWDGDLQGGNGTMVLPTGGYEGSYTFASRFEEGEGTNPEELIAGAHAGCFSMAFANELDGAGHTPDSVETQASVKLETVDGGPTITAIELNTRARVSGIDEETFQQIAERAKENCPVSKALAGPTITLNATLL